MHPMYRTVVPLLPTVPCILRTGQSCHYSPQYHASYVQDPTYRTVVPLLPTVPCIILRTGQSCCYSPQYHASSYVQDSHAATPHSTMHHPTYRTVVPLLPTVPCILCTGQSCRYSPQYHASCVQDSCAATPHSTLFKYIFSQQINLTIFFRLSLAIFLYSSTKCRVFPNVTLLGS